MHACASMLSTSCRRPACRSAAVFCPEAAIPPWPRASNALNRAEALHPSQPRRVHAVSVVYVSPRCVHAVSVVSVVYVCVGAGPRGAWRPQLAALGTRRPPPAAHPAERARQQRCHLLVALAGAGAEQGVYIRVPGQGWGGARAPEITFFHALHACVGLLSCYPYCCVFFTSAGIYLSLLVVLCRQFNAWLAAHTHAAQTLSSLIRRLAIGGIAIALHCGC